MAHEAGETGEGRRLHLEIGDLEAFVFEGFNLFVKLFVHQGEAQTAPLRTEEAVAGHRDTPDHVGLCHAVDQRGVGRGHIGIAHDGTPRHLALELGLQLQVATGVAARIEVEQAVEADALDAGDIGAGRRLGLQSATSAHADEGQRAVHGALRAGGEVDVGQGVELVHHDVDVVAADARGEGRDALALVGARDGVELAALDLTLHGVEVVGYQGDAAGVAHEDHAVGQLFGAEVQVEDATVAIDDQLGGWEIGRCHSVGGIRIVV